MKKVTIFSLLLLLLFLVNWRLASAASASMVKANNNKNSQANRGVENPCDELRSEQTRLALLASNISNANTTRTPEGGPYKPFERIACVNGGCRFTRGTSALFKYEPNHPDAGANGYVAYPNVNVEAAARAFDIAATKLKLIASKNLCSTKILINKNAGGEDSSFMIYYLGSSTSALSSNSTVATIAPATSGAGSASAASASDIKEDIFNLHNGRVVSWARTDAKGEMTTLNMKR